MDHKKLIREMEKATGKKGVPFTVKMKGTRELSRFIRLTNRAHKSAKNSKQRYGFLVVPTERSKND